MRTIQLILIFNAPYLIEQSKKAIYRMNKL